MYVGKSVDILRRLSEHMRAGRLGPQSVVNVKNLLGITKAGLSGAEQLAINTCGSVGETGNLANKINAVSKDRFVKLRDSGIDLAGNPTGL